MGTLEICEELLNQDLEEYVPRISPKTSRKKQVGENDPFKQQDFFRYLVSVASHPIGLRASVKPFNSKEEEMLNYLVDVFDINDFGRLKKILMSYRDSDAEKDRVDQKKLGEIIRSRRRHSWRPELRIRIKPPHFSHRERHYIDNLNVRVYLFKEDESDKPQESDSTSNDATEGSKNQRAVLNNIFKTSKIDLSKRIRPVNEMRFLVKFERVYSSNKNLPAGQIGYKMVRIINGEKIDGDICLKIRRRYCEPNSKYILRFEFWIDSEAVEANWVDQYRRILKRVVYNGSLACGTKGKSVYQNEDQEFYGYVNYNLDQLPSHAVKLDKPIVTIQSRRVNNCELCIEIRNRRLESDDKRITQPVEAGLDRIVPNQDFITNHIRLYAICFLYHSLKLIESRGDSLIESYTMENITIDNLFYMSAQTLINQHRLQSNLNKSEDQALRRIASLLLMNILESKFGGYKRGPGVMLNLLISLARNEYVIARKVIDDKTLQEINPFLENLANNTSDSIVEMEMASLRRFVLGTLKDRVKRYFLPMHPKDDLNRIITLTSLTMLKRALSHHEKLGLVHTKVKNLRFDVSQLREFMTKLLFGLAERHFTIRFEALLERDSTIATQNSTHSYSRSNLKNSNTDSWPMLLRDIRGLSNDMYLYWSTKGIDRLEANEERVSRHINFIDNIERKKISKLIELKIDDFLG